MVVLNKGRWGKYTLKENIKAFLYPQEYLKILDKCNKKQEITLTIQINTGGRINECRNIKVGDIDYERNNLILRVTKVKARKKETKPTPRHIPISSQFVKYLKKIRKSYNLGSEDYFPMLHTAAYNACLKTHLKDIRKVDYNNFSSHNIRKTFECWLIALGLDNFKVAKHLGHTATVAFNSYISPDIFTYEDKNVIRDILGDLYGYRERRF